MAAHGEITPMPDCAIFADTQAEPREVYEWLDWLERQLPFKVHRVTHGNIAEDSLRRRTSGKSGKNYVQNSIPFWIKAPDGSRGASTRKCTRDYKIYPIQRKAKELCGIPKGRLPKTHMLCQWIGISTDEAHRMKPSALPWIKNIWPLIDQDISRDDCIEWMAKRGYPRPPRSACVFCPYHSSTEWQRLKTQQPTDFAVAVEFELSLKAYIAEHDEVIRGEAFMWDGLVNLADADFRPDDRQANLFSNECEGMCGV